MKMFTYGSNMSEKRMKERGVTFSKRYKGVLENYTLTINKKSYKNPKLGYANVKPEENSIVEGVIYDLTEREFLILDKFEGFPLHYRREELDVNVDGKMERCVVYIAQAKWTVTMELQTNVGYKNYLLEGKDLLSSEYLNEKINIIKTL